MVQVFYKEIPFDVLAKLDSYKEVEEGIVVFKHLGENEAVAFSVNGPNDLHIVGIGAGCALGKCATKIKKDLIAVWDGRKIHVWEVPKGDESMDTESPVAPEKGEDEDYF